MPASTSSSEDALLDSLENDTSDPSLTHLREARIQQLSTFLKTSKHLRSEGFGTYTPLTDEKALMSTTTTTKLCIVHFYKPDFNRCRIMDEHLSALAPVHLEARFLKIDVANAPFLVEKLKVRVLPCVIAFVDGVGVDRVVGFEGVGYSEDTFETRDLEVRLIGARVLGEAGGVGDGGVGGSGSGSGSGRREKGREEEVKGNDVDDDDDDWD